MENGKLKVKKYTRSFRTIFKTFLTLFKRRLKIILRYIYHLENYPALNRILTRLDAANKKGQQYV